MDTNYNQLSTEGKVSFCIHEMKKIIDHTKSPLQEEFSQTTNGRTNYFVSIFQAVDGYRSLIKGKIDAEEYSKVANEIATLRAELFALKQNVHKSTIEEKKDVFTHLQNIKAMIE